MSNKSTISKLKRGILSLTGVIILSVGLMFSPAAPNALAASGTITGNVQCFYGNNNEVGVWVNASSGTDGWASLSSDGIGGKNYSYHLSQSSTYRLHVGCSGTPQDWGATMYSPYVSGQSYSWVCSYSTSYGFFCAMS